MSRLLIQNGRIIDPANDRDSVGDLLIENGKIAPLSGGIFTGDVSEVDQLIDATGLIVSPGFIDCHVAFREPGEDEDETIESGSAAALAGGMTTVAVLPDTSPPVDTRAAADFFVRQAERARKCRVYPLGAVTSGLIGEELAEMGQLFAGGAVGFSDGKQAIANAEIMRRALQYTTIWDKPILHHAQVPELVHGAIMHEGFQSTKLGLRAMPAAAEHIMVLRDIALAEATKGRIHLMSISSKRSVEEIERAQRNNIRVTADVTPHHLLLTDEMLEGYDTNYKVSPPLRTEEHRQALIDGLKSGTIGMISSDHQPHAAEKKSLEIDHAPFGISGLETLLPLCLEALVQPQHLTMMQFIEKLTVNPASLLGLKGGRLDLGTPADVVIFDPNEEWTIDPSQFKSRSRNTPFANRRVKGRVKHTIVSGEVRYTD